MFYLAKQVTVLFKNQDNKCNKYTMQYASYEHTLLQKPNGIEKVYRQDVNKIAWTS